MERFRVREFQVQMAISFPTALFLLGRFFPSEPNRSIWGVCVSIYMT